MGPRMLLVTSMTLAAACAAEPLVGQGFWPGEEEPPRSWSADESGEPPLTVFLSREQTDVRTILWEDLGTLQAGRTGTLTVDGRGLTDDVVLVFDGELHRYDGGVDRHRLAVRPFFVSQQDGAANAAGFLRVDFRRPDRIRVVEATGEPFASTPGVFRGDIVAVAGLDLDGEIDEDLSRYAIPPRRFSERSPNVLRDVTLYFRPNVALTRLAPSPRCPGFPVIDTTLGRTPLDVEASAAGFPEGAPVRVQVTYRVPVMAGTSFVEHLWDYLSWSVADVDVTRVAATGTSRGGRVSVALPRYTTEDPEWGASHFSMEIEVRASSGRIHAEPLLHNLDVVREGRQVVVSAFELCPLGDEPCRLLRDGNEAENVLARRAIIEWRAESLGLYDRVTRPISRCAGGDVVAGAMSDDCRVYRESTDAELRTRLAAELNFELNVDGEGRGKASWGGDFFGIASGEVEGAIKASFSLDVDLAASFETSTTWRNRHSLDVIYDPGMTQVQWWRIVQPRLRYMELAEFDACGVRVTSHDFFLEDLRDSRLVLACEEVPSYDSVCHAVEPTAEAAAACDDLLLAPDSERGRACLGD